MEPRWSSASRSAPATCFRTGRCDLAFASVARFLPHLMRSMVAWCMSGVPASMARQSQSERIGTRGCGPTLGSVLDLRPKVSGSQGAVHRPDRHCQLLCPRRHPRGAAQRVVIHDVAEQPHFLVGRKATTEIVSVPPGSSAQRRRHQRSRTGLGHDSVSVRGDGSPLSPSSLGPHRRRRSLSGRAAAGLVGPRFQGKETPSALQMAS
jgi:hypothetical protein